MSNRQPTPEELLQLRRRMQQKGMDAQSQQTELLRFAGQNMNAEQQRTFQHLLRDKEAMQKLLQSEQAQKLMQRLKDKP